MWGFFALRFPVSSAGFESFCTKLTASNEAYHRDTWHDLTTGLLDQRVKQLDSGGPALIQCSAEAREFFRAFHRFYWRWCAVEGSNL